jgi:hypothetical protein
MRHLTALLVVMFAGSVIVTAHDFGTQITWNREISRIVYDHCASCHREGGTSFSLMTYREAQPYADEIKEAVLARRMPPWGAVKGFGDFRNDEGLTQEQVELMTNWVEGGILKGNNPNMLPKVPKFEREPLFRPPAGGIRISGTVTLKEPFTLDGLLLEKGGNGTQIVAVLPDGAVKPLLWLYEYNDKYKHPFLLRRAMRLPAGTMIRGVRPPVSVMLLPAALKGVASKGTASKGTQ